ncbi:MAG TPA: HAD hydrolase-like protein [bacterium]|nr:HAD hydrolase-like protein [bacterium]HOL34392.1 HAD hydrolase-like protein [bacterium]HPP07957.1 HAD hydrolase-like protein [bacterium]
MKKKAIVFDFDGPLVGSGQDKAIHILFSAFVACHDTGFRKFLHPDHPELDISKMLKGLVNYPGAPRFQQLSAIVSSIVRDIPEAVADPHELCIDESLVNEYQKLQQRYNEFYSGLNEAAAKRFWKPLKGVKTLIKKLSKDYDLYVASGIIQDILEKDFQHHKFDRKLFCGIMGSNQEGNIDKSMILKQIKNRSYQDVLFIGDSRKDLEYARKAGVKFFRVKSAQDYKVLVEKMKQQDLPDVQDMCEFTEQQLQRIRSKTLALMNQYLSGKILSYQEITTFINSKNN